MKMIWICPKILYCIVRIEFVLLYWNNEILSDHVQHKRKLVGYNFNLWFRSWYRFNWRVSDEMSNRQSKWQIIERQLNVLLIEFCSFCKKGIVTNVGNKMQILVKFVHNFICHQYRSIVNESRLDSSCFKFS